MVLLTILGFERIALYMTNVGSVMLPLVGEQGAGSLSALLILVKGQDVRRIANF